MPNNTFHDQIIGMAKPDRTRAGRPLPQDWRVNYRPLNWKEAVALVVKILAWSKWLLRGSTLLSTTFVLLPFFKTLYATA